MRTHPLDVSALVTGLIFLGLSGAWALRESGVVDDQATGWVLPLMLVGAGAIGLIAWTTKGVLRSRRGTEEESAS